MMDMLDIVVTSQQEGPGPGPDGTNDRCMNPTSLMSLHKCNEIESSTHAEDNVKKNVSNNKVKSACNHNRYHYDFPTCLKITLKSNEIILGPLLCISCVFVCPFVILHTSCHFFKVSVTTAYMCNIIEPRRGQDNLFFN